MSVADVNVARPMYMSWTLFRDYHFAVFNDVGEVVLLLCTFKDGLKSFFVSHFDEKVHRVVFVDSMLKATINLGDYSRDPKDLQAELTKQGNPPGKYRMELVNTSGDKIAGFDVWI